MNGGFGNLNKTSNKIEMIEVEKVCWPNEYIMFSQ